jgi:ABC-type sugar transport system substrate-binding protein
MQSAFFEAEQSKAIETGESGGATVVSVVADGDANKQKSQIEDLISKGVDAVVCVPHDSVAIVSSIDDCKAAGIPFIAMGRMPSDMTNVTLGITCDNDLAAKVDVEAAVANAKELGYDKLKAIEIVGALTDQGAVERSDSFKKYCAENDIEIVAEVASEWDADKAFNRLTDVMTTVGDDYNLIYVPSDFLLDTVKSVLSSNNRWVPAGEEGHVIIVSIDGDPGAMQYIKDGYVLATANTDAFDFGKNAMLGAIDIAKGNAPTVQIQPIPTIALDKATIESAGDTIWGNVY